MIQSFGSHGLFGIFNHDIALKKAEKLTIVHGPNGFGKTTLLRLLRDFFDGKFAEFNETPLDDFYIQLEDGTRVTLTKPVQIVEGAESRMCQVVMTDPLGNEFVHLIPVLENDRFLVNEMEKIAPFMRRVSDDVWEDIRDGEILDTDELVGRFGVRRGALKDRRVFPDWLSGLMGSVKVRLIETQRLILQKKAVRHAPSRNRPPSTATITDYAQQLSGKIQASFNEYARLSQQLDQTFVVRLLKHDFTVEEVLPGNSLAVKVESLNQKRRRLRDSGLLSKEDEPLPLPEEATPLIDQILSAYLQDVESKLAVFDTLLGKIELLKSIVDAHLEYKTMVISQQSGFYFRAKFEKASRILPASLSSGEQHILILFYDLLFNDSENSLILIDEPEISLHVDWQLSFLDDLRRIVSIAPHDILLATHSPQIINNDWDLTVSLSRPEDAAGR